MRNMLTYLMLAASACGGEHRAEPMADDAMACPEVVPMACPEVVPAADACPMPVQFAIAPTALFDDLSFEQIVLSIGVVPQCGRIVADALFLSFHEVLNGHTADTDVCAVFACEDNPGIRVLEHVTDQTFIVTDGVDGSSFSGTIAEADGSSHEVPVGGRALFVFSGQVRTDAPPGRYRFHLEDISFSGVNGAEYRFPGYPAMGPEIVVPER